jgi:transcription termination/antitermination protein NusG
MLGVSQVSQNWYIIHTISGHEKKIASSILEQAKKKSLDSKITEAIVPTEEVTEVRRGKKVSAQKKFLPGYLLIRMEMDDAAWHLIKDISKASKFLGTNGKPHPIKDEEAERIIKQMEEGAEGSKNILNFEPGESVKVIDGPFESFVGVVSDVDCEKSRLKVSVSIFGRATPVDLEFTQVEKI